MAQLDNARIHRDGLRHGSVVRPSIVFASNEVRAARSTIFMRVNEGPVVRFREHRKLELVVAGKIKHGTGITVCCAGPLVS